jgi:hypothetical protein
VFFEATIVYAENNKDATLDIHKSNYSILRQIQYSFTLQNKTNRLLEKAEFWTYAPVKQTATQRTIHLEVKMNVRKYIMMSFP